MPLWCSRRPRINAATALAAAAAGLLLTALAPSIARARVTVSRRQIVVTSAQARALISRSPFRIRFADGAGRVVLSEVRSARPAPQPEPPTADPLAPGFDNPAAAPLYAPLSFTVGTQTLTQYAGGIWGGNPMTGTRSGIRYSARRVIGLRRAGGGVRLSSRPAIRLDGGCSCSCGRSGARRSGSPPGSSNRRASHG